MSGFHIDERDLDGIKVLELNGFLDAHTAPTFEQSIEEQVKAGHYKIIINLSNLEYISSAGLGVFMGFIEDIREHSGDIKICNASDKVYKVFDLLGFPNLFDIVDDEESAKQKFEN
ncbi:MAG: STAS domain-containing protein [Calditrichaeota bacterium]|nr:STAS domain-containing protein [Calditrichota bacterium]